MFQFAKKEFNILDDSTLILFFEDEDEDEMEIRQTTELKDAISLTFREKKRVLRIMARVDVEISPTPKKEDQFTKMLSGFCLLFCAKNFFLFFTVFFFFFFFVSFVSIF